MARDIDDELLVHYLAGECTDEEKARVEAWVRADPSHRQKFEEMRWLWEEAGRRGSRDVDAMWSKLSKRMESSPGDSGEGMRVQREGRSPRISRSRWSDQLGGVNQSVRTAAFIVVIAVVAFTVGQIFSGVSDRAETPVMREVATAAGERARIDLGDGTQVILNAESKLVLPREFVSDRRLVQLEGEAYFEVEFEAERPFMVRAGGTVTRVLGTRFNVGAYSDQENVNVVVAEGKVAVRSEDSGEDQELLLRRHQMGSFSKHEQRALRQEVDVSSHLAWTEGKLVFDDAPFDEVDRKLERRYDIHVTVREEVGPIDRLNASFGEEPLGEVLRIIAESLELRYEREGDLVRFEAATSP